MEKRIEFIDLSIPLQSNTCPGLPAERDLTYNPKITYFDHRVGAEEMKAIFDIRDDDLPDRLGWANEEITLQSHTGTHLDSPWHYGPISEGRRAMTVDELPLDWFFGNGVVLDFRHKEPTSIITREDIENALKKINYILKAKDIVLLLTGADKYLGTKDYVTKGIGMGRESTLFLVEKGVKIIGTDSPGFDRPFWAIARDFKEDGKKEKIWQAHYSGKIKGYCQIEKMTNLDKLPSHGFKVACFPIKILKASAAWVRPIAMIETEE